MGETTKIEWCDATFNAWIGCAKVSPACANCYAEVDTFARVQRSKGRELWGVNAERHVTSKANWHKPIAWEREAHETGVRKRVFCSSLSDVFENDDRLMRPRARLWQLIADTPHLDWLLLTKRPEHANELARLAALHAWDGGGVNVEVWPRNIWLGTTVENQEYAVRRVPALLETPAAVHFLSAEPLLEAIHLRPWLTDDPVAWPHGVIDWVIVGAESGPHARPFDIRWAYGVLEQCDHADTACFIKQLGPTPFHGEDGAGWAHTNIRGKHWRWNVRRGDGSLEVYETWDAKGGDWSTWPADLRTRQWPEVQP